MTFGVNGCWREKPVHIQIGLQIGLTRNGVAAEMRASQKNIPSGELT